MSHQKYYTSVLLFFFYNSICFCQQSIYNNVHFNLLADFINTSAILNAEIDTFFEIKPTVKKYYYRAGEILPNDSSRKTILNTRNIHDTIRQIILKQKNAAHFIYQIASTSSSQFICAIYQVGYNTFKSRPSLFCNFKLIYSIDGFDKIAIIRFEKRNVM